MTFGHDMNVFSHKDVTFAIKFTACSFYKVSFKYSDNLTAF